MEIKTNDDENKQRVSKLLNLCSIVYSGRKNAFKSKKQVIDNLDKIEFREETISKRTQKIINSLLISYKKIINKKSSIPEELNNNLDLLRLLFRTGGWTNDKEISVQTKRNLLFSDTSINYKVDRALSHELFHQFVDLNSIRINEKDNFKYHYFEETLVDLLSLVSLSYSKKYPEVAYLDPNSILREDISKEERYIRLADDGYMKISNITRLLIASCETCKNDYQDNLDKGLSLFNLKEIDKDNYHYSSNPFIYGITHDFDYFKDYFIKYSSEAIYNILIEELSNILLLYRKRDFKKIRPLELECKNIIDDFFIKRITCLRGENIINDKDLSYIVDNYRKVSENFMQIKYDIVKESQHKIAFFKETKLKEFLNKKIRKK